jgi:hypothetical protein
MVNIKTSIETSFRTAPGANPEEQKLGFGVPYFSQWESAGLASKFISGELQVRDDPSWSTSGAVSQDEYAQWANHICGMACAKMILAARTGTVWPSMALTRMAVESGAYVVDKDGIRGMIYAPFVEMAKSRFGIDAKVVTNITAAGLPSILQPGSLFIASVHPSIRWLRPPPPKKGGHLVLVTKADENAVVFHNPSGDTLETQENATAPLQMFGEFFAGRGVLIP